MKRHPFDGWDDFKEAVEHREETAQWLRDTGLLWAINHYLLHPVGVALAVNVRSQPGDPNYGKDLTPEQVPLLGRFVLWPTKDPEGWEFTPEADAEGRAQLEAALPELAARLEILTVRRRDET